MSDFETTEFDGQKAELVDEELLGVAPITSDSEPTEFPPERPLGVNDLAVTAWGETIGESLDDRHRHEDPETFSDEFVSPPDPAVLRLEAEAEIIGDPMDMSAEEAALHSEISPGQPNS
jgi:hypothetical protein